jgi:ubiquitin C-terminal hydrolase
MDKLNFIKNFKPIGLGNSGIYNLGNTCFMNSAFQCLSHTIPLTKFFLTGKVVEDFNTDKEEAQLCKEYVRVLMAIWEDNCIVKPVSFYKHLGKFHNAYTGFRQHDSHELLVRLIDVLHIAVSYQAEITCSGTPLIESDKMKVEAFKVWAQHFKDQYSFIVDLFYGQFNSSMVCNLCDHIYHSYDPFCSISLPINGNITDIYQSFNEFTSKEILDEKNKWKCDKCNQLNQATKKITIWKSPKILVLSLKRFDHLNRKNSKLVDYPIQGLNLNKYVFNGTKDIYDLYAISCHMGSANMGHYISICKNQDGKWYCFNDENVTQFDESKLVSEHAYMLLYKRRDVSFD